MAKQGWGKKRFCQSCGVSFYDLGRKNIECPKCHAPFDLKPPAKRKRPVPSAQPAEAAAEKAGTPPENPVAAPAAVVAGDDGPGVEAGTPPTGDGGGDGGDKGEGETVDDEEKSDELIEDTSDLGRDDDDMSEVKEHIDDAVEDKN